MVSHQGGNLWTRDYVIYPTSAWRYLSLYTNDSCDKFVVSWKKDETEIESINSEAMKNEYKVD